MKKRLFAALLLTGSLAVSAAGQSKSGITVTSSPSSIAAGASSISTATRVRVTARNVGNDNSPVNPAPSASVAANLTQIYRVGVGDVLDVQLPQSPTNKSTLFTVLDGGILDYPLVGTPLQVAGLTTSQVATLLQRQIRVFENPAVAVKVRDYASHAVTVSGLVGSPGVKTLQREAVPLYVVLSQSMVLPEAGRATILRAGRQPATVSLTDSKASSTLVMSGDVIKISAAAAPSEFFFAGGEINLPGQKAFHAGLTLTQAILASGGLNKNASQKVSISRQGSDGRLVKVEYNLGNIQSGKIADPVLQKGDRLHVEGNR